MTAARKWRYGAMSNAVIDERGRLIASLDGRDSDGEDVLRADGTLLAAAPLMAEALQLLLAEPNSAFCRDKARDALAAAAKVQS